MARGPGLVGRKIKKIRWMTEAEVRSEGWSPRFGRTVALELDDGTIVFGAADYEGNASGALFGRDRNGSFYVTVPGKKG